MTLSSTVVAAGLTAVGAAGLGVAVLVRERGSAVRWAFFVVAMAPCIWFGAFSFMYATNDPATAYLWARVAYIGVPFLPSGIYTFGVHLLRERHRFRTARLLLTVSAAFALAAWLSDDLVRGVRHYAWGYYPLYGGIGIALVVFFVITMSWSLSHFLVAHQNAEGHQRARLRWIIAAFAVGYSASVDFLPKFGVAVYPFGFVPIAGFLVVIALGIRRHRLVAFTPSFAADQILATSADPIISCDADGAIQLVNPAATRLLGIPEHELLGKSIDWLRHPTAPDAITALPSAHTDDHETTFRDARGAPIAVSLSTAPLTDWDGKPVGAVVVARDVRARRAAERALRESEERYALAAQGANDGLWDWDVRSNRVYYSTRWRDMLGLSEGEVGNTLDDWFARVHADDRARVSAELAHHMDGSTPHFESEYRIRHADGSWRWVLTRGLAVRSEGEVQPHRLAGSQTDITDRKLAEERLLHDAFHDQLTGLPNRALFLDRLRQAVGRARRRRGRFAVLFVDLDRFKMVNDSMGHAAGDGLLVAVSERLAALLRPGDTVARLGGDEFTALIEDVMEAGEAAQVADRIQSALQSPVVVEGVELFVTASIGIALGHEGYGSAEDVLRDADIAMYAAKRGGKARYAVFDPAMHADVVSSLRMETDLRRALERQQLALVYQPVVNAADGVLQAFEALLRWDHPAFGRITPARFIPVAEETGLIVPIGAWVLETACGQLASWRAAGARPDLAMSVNLSARQFQAPDLVATVAGVLSRAGLPPALLRLEITESVLMDDVEGAIETLTRLRALGVRLYIDDFGTGYSSLSYLQRLPVDTLKIDRTFVNRLATDPQARQIVRTIMALAHELALEVVAEGVETSGQRDELLALECRLAQGYLYAHPLSAEDAAALARAARESV